MARFGLRFGLRQDAPKDPVGQVIKHRENEVAVVDLGRVASEALRMRMENHQFETGSAIDSAWLQPLLGAGSTAASSLLAGNVFLATANPATLMTIGGGVGSAVIGSSGTIVAQAPFVAASSALLPAVAPVMLFMTVSSVITGARLDRVERTLGALAKNLERVRHLLEAGDYARLESAAEYLDEIGAQFRHGHRFTEGMKMELVSARRDVKWLRRKFEHFATREKIGSVEEAEAAVFDINLFVLSSLADLRADALRLYLALHEDPRSAGPRQAELHKKAEQCANTFRALLDRDPLTAFRDQSQQDLGKAGRFESLPWGLSDVVAGVARTLGAGDSLKKQVETLDALLEKLAPVRSSMEQWVGAFDDTRAASVMFYRERDGERALKAYHTRDLMLQAVRPEQSRDRPEQPEQPE